MSYLYKGSKIQVAQPVRSISINKNQVVFADKSGAKCTRFATASDARTFIKWLKSTV